MYNVTTEVVKTEFKSLSAVSACTCTPQRTHSFDVSVLSIQICFLGLVEYLTGNQNVSDAFSNLVIQSHHVPRQTYCDEKVKLSITQWKSVRIYEVILRLV
jgi:hypothetical protein